MFHLLLEEVHASSEVEADEAADSTQDEVPGDTVYEERLRDVQREHRLCAREDIGEGCSCNRRDQKGRDGSHSEVHHEHLEREDKSGNRCFEDTADSTCGAAAYHAHHRLLVKTESLGEVRTDRRAREDNRSLSSDRSTEADS